MSSKGKRAPVTLDDVLAWVIVAWMAVCTVALFWALATLPARH